jgi:integrase/recombinase XerD
MMNLDLFFRWLVKQHHLLFNPVGCMELPKPSKCPPCDPLTIDEVEAIINQPDIKTPFGIRDRAILETLYSSGIRAGELVHLKVEDLNITYETLVVRRGKGQKDRIVPVGQRALQWLEKYLLEVRPLWLTNRDEATLFVTQYGRAFRSIHTLGHLLAGYIKAANIVKKGRAHMFRRTMATLMLENGADIHYIKEILGHADLQTTERYTRVSIGKLKQIHSLTHPAELSWHEPTGEDNAPKT